MALLAVTAFMGVAKHYHKAGGNAVKGDGNRAVEARTVTEYTGIKVRGRIDVRLSQGPEKKVEVNAAKNIVPLVSTVVNNGVLIIETTGRINEDETIEVSITTPAIQTLDMSEGAYIESINTFTGDKLTVNSNGGSNGRLKLQYKNLECHLNTGSEIDLDGNTDEASLSVSTGANLDANDLVVQKCKVEGNTGANTTVNVSQELTADINTGSVLNYRGDPAKTNITSSAGGSVQKR